jgi:hypothetical protein
MGTVSRLDHDKARNNPEAVFERPEDLSAEVGLTRGEKIAALKRWQGAVQRRLDSADEGMGQNWRQNRAVGTHASGASGDAPEPPDKADLDAELARRIDIELGKLVGG